jgi:hypothetical protein
LHIAHLLSQYYRKTTMQSIQRKPWWWHPGSFDDLVEYNFWRKDILDCLIEKWMKLPLLGEALPFKLLASEFVSCCTEIKNDQGLDPRTRYEFVRKMGDLVTSWMEELCTVTGVTDARKEELMKKFFLDDEKDEGRIQTYFDFGKRLLFERDDILRESIKKRKWDTCLEFIQQRRGIFRGREEDTLLHIALSYGAPKVVVEGLLDFYHPQVSNTRGYRFAHEEPIYAAFTPDDRNFVCDVATIQFLLDNGAIVRNFRSRVPMDTILDSLLDQRKVIALHILAHNYKNETTLVVNDSGVRSPFLWRLLLEHYQAQNIQRALILLKYGADPYLIFAGDVGLDDENERYIKRNFFTFAKDAEASERVSKSLAKNYKTIIHTVTTTCILISICATRVIPRLAKAKISVIAVEQIGILKTVLL